MKIGEALSNRKDLLRQANEYAQRALNYAVMDRDNPTDENPMDYLLAANDALRQYENLSNQINAANIEHGIMQMTAQRDRLRTISQHYKSLAQSGRNVPRYGREEIVYVPTFDVKEANRLGDELAAAARRLDIQIQETDWTVEI